MKRTKAASFPAAAPESIDFEPATSALIKLLDDSDSAIRLEAIRGLVGPKVPIVVSLDGHANVTPKMGQHATMLIGVKTNPHYDFAPTGRLGARVIAGIGDGSISPVSAWAQPAMAPALTRRSGLRNPAFTGRLYQEGTTTARP